MASIDISRNHTLGKAAIKEKVNGILDRLRGELGLQGAWDGDVYKITKPAEGSFTITDTTVRVLVDLPFMLRPLKGKVEERINGELNKALA